MIIGFSLEVLLGYLGRAVQSMPICQSLQVGRRFEVNLGSKRCIVLHG